jgi:uncharacterized protein (DUF433 family)
MLAEFTPREVAELSGAPKTTVEKAIEEKVLATTRAKLGRRERRVLPAYTVAYAKIIGTVKYRLDLPMKRRLASKLVRLTSADLKTMKFELEPSVEMDVGRLVGDAMERAEWYSDARDRLIVEDGDVLGGTPIIRGTRISVYAVRGRVEDRDAVDDILTDHPGLTREAIDAAVIYARTHPLVGRPRGRPWASAA